MLSGKTFSLVPLTVDGAIACLKIVFVGYLVAAFFLLSVLKVAADLCYQSTLIETLDRFADVQ
jgi:hypothetical protein